MIVEEAIAILIREIDEDPFLRTEHREKIHEALKMGIKALGQMGALDKIVAEVQALPKTYPFYNHIDTYVKDDDVVKIIDQYRK